MILGIILGVFFFLVIETISPLSGIHMLAYIFVGGMFSWIMWVHDRKMAVMGIMSTVLCVLYTLFEVIEPVSNLVKKFIGG